MNDTAKSEPTPGHEKTDSNAQHSDELSLTKFAKALPELLAKELHTKLYFAERGIFVSEGYVAPLVAAYKKWYHAVTQRELSDEKATKRMFGEHAPELEYLINGKSCIIGYLAPCKGVNNVRCSIPSCFGAIESTVTTLHHRDPIWNEIEGLSLTVGDSGIKSTLAFKDRTLNLSREALEMFGAIYSRARWMKRLSSSPIQNRREGLRVLVKFLKRARPRGRKLSVLIPAKYRNKSVDFIGVASIVFVVERRAEATFELLGCYDLRPPAFGELIDQEIKELARGLNKPRQGSMEVRTDSKGRVTISFYAQQERFEIDPHGLGQVLSECQRDPRSAPKLFTAFDLIRAISRVFERSIWIQPDRVSKSFSSHAARYPRIRSANGWLFFIDRSNTVKMFARDGRAEGPPLLTPQRDDNEVRSARPQRPGRPGQPARANRRRGRHRGNR